MNSMNSDSSFSNDFSLSSLLFYTVFAALFFYLGRNYDRIRQEVQEQTVIKRSSKVIFFFNSIYLCVLCCSLLISIRPTRK